MTDINDLMQEFWTRSSGGAVDVFFTAMRCLFSILNVCSDIIFIRQLPPTLLIDTKPTGSDAQGFQN
jgi:hypothetical protein